MTDHPFTLESNDAFHAGVKLHGLVRVFDDYVGVSFTPYGQQGVVIMWWRPPTAWTFGEYVASVAPNLLALSVIAAWNSKGRPMMCGDVEIASFDPELARAPAALDSHADAIHSKGSPA